MERVEASPDTGADPDRVEIAEEWDAGFERCRQELQPKAMSESVAACMREFPASATFGPRTESPLISGGWTAEGAQGAFDKCERNGGSAEECRADGLLGEDAALCIARAGCLTRGLDPCSAYLAFMTTQELAVAIRQNQFPARSARMVWVVSTTTERSDLEWQSYELGLDARTGETLYTRRVFATLFYSPAGDD